MAQQSLRVVDTTREHPRDAAHKAVKRFRTLVEQENFPICNQHTEIGGSYLATDDVLRRSERETREMGNEITAEISVSISKLVDRDSANEAADLKAADLEKLREMGFTVTGLSFFYWPKGEAPAWFKARHGKTA